MDKLWYVKSYSRIIFSNNKGQAINTPRSLEYLRDMLSNNMTPCIWHSQKDKTTVTETKSVVRNGGEGMTGKQ